MEASGVQEYIYNDQMTGINNRQPFEKANTKKKKKKLQLLSF